MCLSHSTHPQTFLVFPFPKPFPFDIICVLLDWVALLSLQALAWTNHMLFEEAEKRRWKSLSIELDPRPKVKRLMAAPEVLFRIVAALCA